MNHTEPLRQLCANESVALDSLYQVLQHEQQAVAARDTEQMDSVLGQKLDLLEQLQQLDQQRQHLLQRAGLEDSRDNFRQLLQQHGLELSLWESLEQRLRQCHQLHQVNSRLLDRNYQQVRKILQLMVGGEQGGRVDLYDRQGTTAQNLTTYTSIRV